MKKYCSRFCPFFSPAEKNARAWCSRKIDGVFSSLALKIDDTGNYIRDHYCPFSDFDLAQLEADRDIDAIPNFTEFGNHVVLDVITCQNQTINGRTIEEFETTKITINFDHIVSATAQENVKIKYDSKLGSTIVADRLVLNLISGLSYWIDATMTDWINFLEKRSK